MNIHRLSSPSSTLPTSRKSAFSLGHVSSAEEIDLKVASLRDHRSAESVMSPEVLTSLQHRLALLEQDMSHKPHYPLPYSSSLPPNAPYSDTRLMELEQKLNRATAQMEKLSIDLNESRQELQASKRSQGKLQEELDALRGEVELRRTQSLRTETSLRQQEAWRNEVEADVAALRQQLRFNERLTKDHEELLRAAVMRSDLDSGVYLDRLSASIQRGVLNSLAGLKTQRDLSSAMTDNLPTTSALEDHKEGLDDKVQSYLDAQLQRSVELAVQFLRSQLEESILNRALFELRNELRDVKTECSNRISSLAVAAGVVESGQSAGSLAGMNINSVRILEKSLASLELKVDTFESNIRSARNQSELQEKSVRAELTALQGRVDDCLAFSESQLTLAKERASNLENLVCIVVLLYLL